MLGGRDYADAMDIFESRTDSVNSFLRKLPPDLAFGMALSSSTHTVPTAPMVMGIL